MKSSKLTCKVSPASSQQIPHNWKGQLLRTPKEAGYFRKRDQALGERVKRQ
jgi:hypothetical protein